MENFTCTKCDICTLNNYRPLLGDGSKQANIMFVSRNPDSYEIRNNVPLINKAGMLFQDYLDLFNFSRDSVFITNAVKCKTPGNRFPTDKEIFNCRQYLQDEIEEIDPRIIVLLGVTATRSYFKLAFTDVNVDMNYLNAKYMTHNNRVILFAIHPSHTTFSFMGRVQLFQAFQQLTTLYRYINPAHLTNLIY